MFTWNHSETVEVAAKASQIWAIWSDAKAWPVWDKELEWVELDGAFVEGSKGRMKPTNGPQIAFELVKVKREECFVDRAKLPLTRLDFGHIYTHGRDGGEAARITHSVEFRGLLAPLFGFLIGRNIKKHLRAAMLDLARRAETDDKTRVDDVALAKTVER